MEVWQVSNLPKPPAGMTGHTITLKMPDGTSDMYGKRKTRDVVIDKVHVQPDTVYEGTDNGRKVVANAIIFIFGGVSTNVPVLDESVIGCKLSFGTHTWTIQKVLTNYIPGTMEVYSYELEVL